MPENILIVDGDPRNTEALQAVLKGYFNIRLADCHERAVVMANGADLILLAAGTDWNLLRRLKADKGTAAIPVILTAPHTSAEDEIHAFDLGAADIIHQPFSPPLVLARVSTHLALRQARAVAERTAAESVDARRQAESAMRQLRQTTEIAEQSARELETLFENAWIGVFIITPDRIIRRANRHCEEIIFGWKRGEMIGRKSRVFYRSDEEFEAFGRNAYPFLAAGQRYLTREAVFCRKDGTAFLAQAVGSLIDPADPSRGTIWLVNDITERKAAEEKLARTLAELEIIFENARIGIAYVRERRVVRVNQTFEAMFGFTNEELIGRPTRVIYRSDEAYETIGRDAYSALCAGAPSYRVDTPVRRKDGGEMMCELVGSLVDRQDPDKGSIWLMSDVTELRRAQEQLREAKEAAESAAAALRDKTEQIAGLLDSSGQGFLSFGADLVIGPAYSRACVTMLGGAPAGRQADDLLFPADAAARQLMRDCVADALAAPDAHARRMFLSLIPAEAHLGGRILHLAFHPTETGVMAVVSDVTAERELSRKVARESRRLEMIVAAVTDGADFFAAVDEFRDFVKAGPQALARQAAESVHRTVHTFKGTFNQFGFYHVPQTLHEVETRLQARLAEAPADEIAAIVFAADWNGLLEHDLRTVVDALGADFLVRRGVVALSPEQAHAFERLAARLLRSNHVGERDRAPLAELASIRAVSLKKELGYYERMIRRIAAGLDKAVRPLVLEGEDVRLDPDQWGPLLRSLGHVFRNAVDHGVEDPEIRFAAGKDEEAAIVCRISRTAKALRLEIADDGAGIDEEALRARAARLGINAVGMRLTDLVCLDGVSTRETATELSGRGVGMAAVRAEAARLGGSLQVASMPGRGTKVILDVPFAEARR